MITPPAPQFLRSYRCWIVGQPCLGQRRKVDRSEDCFRNRGPRSRTTAAMGYHAFLYLWSLFFPSNEILLWSFNHSTRVDLEPTHHTNAIAAALTQLEPYFFKSPQQQIIAQFSFFEWGQQIQQMESKWWCSSLLLKHCKNSSHKSQQIISGGSFLVSSTSVNFRFRLFFQFSHWHCTMILKQEVLISTD